MRQPIQMHSQTYKHTCSCNCQIGRHWHWQCLVIGIVIFISILDNVIIYLSFIKIRCHRIWLRVAGRTEQRVQYKAQSLCEYRAACVNTVNGICIRRVTISRRYSITPIGWQVGAATTSHVQCEVCTSGCTQLGRTYTSVNHYHRLALASYGADHLVSLQPSWPKNTVVLNRTFTDRMCL